MPQLDFFAWVSMGFWTILSFHFFYLYMLRNIVGPFSELQKSVQKLDWALSHTIGSLRKRLFHTVYSGRLFVIYKLLGNYERIRLKFPEMVLRPNGMTKVLTLYDKRVAAELFEKKLAHYRFWKKAAPFVPMKD